MEKQKMIEFLTFLPLAENSSNRKIEVRLDDLTNFDKVVCLAQQHSAAMRKQAQDVCPHKNVAYWDGAVCRDCGRIWYMEYEGDFPPGFEQGDGK